MTYDVIDVCKHSFMMFILLVFNHFTSAILDLGTIEIILVICSATFIIFRLLYSKFGYMCYFSYRFVFVANCSLPLVFLFGKLDGFGIC